MGVVKPEDAVKEALLKEEDLLMDKTMYCPVCDRAFKEKAVKSSRLRRKENDKDLRPRFYDIDTQKYDVSSCPYCGYTAMNRYFPHVSAFQRKLILEAVDYKIRKDSKSANTLPAFYDYDTAIDRYKASLFFTEVKKGAVSEQAYTYLKMAWLYRGKCEELLQKDFTEEAKEIKESRQKETHFYELAYEGFVQAMAKEMPPICGMDQNTLEFLIAEMAFYLGKYDVAAKTVSEILVSQTANRHFKDKALELKQEIIAKIKGAELH